MPGRHSRTRGLDPWREHDACGVGFVARVSGERSADVTQLALQALARVAHRGAAATDRSGDGAGLLTQIPAALFYREAASRGMALERGQPFAVGAFFLPGSDDDLCRATGIIEDALRRKQGDVQATATLLGIPKQTLYDKIKRLSVDVDGIREGAVVRSGS